ncbi:dTDP-4-dehydrorhamnose 3,5-epimerase family protein [Candidatus Peregrinibacteria bacterium]|nr:dTDP-4-dehydrorhamnose 3,5-epimerase family protein [Candidatus Peregrinibacteria bacterium]
MKIVHVHPLSFPEIQVIRFERFRDSRGYFTENFRKSDFHQHPEMRFLQDVEFLQCNESFSFAQTVRGLHFQWNPFIGKLVRTVFGHMIDLILDIRKGSATFGKIIAYDMPASTDRTYSEWIWLPPGFAHGNFFLKETLIEYFCSGEYNPSCEASISPLARDIDWSLCDPDLKRLFQDTIFHNPRISEKDKNGFTVDEWKQNPHSDKFL